MSKRKAKLPPDPEGRNEDRASFAEAAMGAFHRKCHTEREDGLADLLANLMHWADRNGFKFETELRRARMHYEAETAKDYQG
jgi:hypothetical protein